ncbi:type III pantothenate kinase [Stieleria sp. ICT_E10.1]|uniref:type III pantothenate kinase n=1 Tax=Stieleria sedimenti TaxID=2976331 RepID=UPI00217F6FE3|nr:type III pantothenate kinase [Stieleria sedimenti]MCS7468378.1 type III pantothenate kinase [Stieleria sedimenti]
MTPAETIAAIDVGNSAIKVALADTSELLAGAVNSSAPDAALRYQTFPLDQPQWDKQVCRWVQQQTGQSQVSWRVSTVNHAASRPLHDAVCDVWESAPRTAGGPRQVDWRHLSARDVPLQIRVDAPEKVGIDRLLSAYAASNRFDPPLVVVDAGSAVTVDCVCPSPDAPPVFAGGAILPGIRLQHAALVTGTEGLQQATQETVPDGDGAMAPATNTRLAIRLGVLAAVVGGVERLAREYAGLSPSCHARENGDADGAFRIVLSGGDAVAISPYMRARHELVPHLVCLGILDLAIRQCQFAPSGLE